VESYCKEYNAKYADITKEAGLILVETVNLLIGLQASDVDRYSLEPFVVTRNCFGADPTVAVIQLETDLQVPTNKIIVTITAYPPPPPNKIKDIILNNIYKPNCIFTGWYKHMRRV